MAKAVAIVADLRGKIVGGQYAPGGRIPSHLELAEQFGVAVMTVQAILRQLRREGFIEARGQAGTFVAERPPHLNHYGLVFCTDPHGYAPWSKYFAALTEAARQLDGVDGRRIQLFHGIDEHTDTPDYQQLLELVRTHRLAGLIFAHFPFQLVLQDSPLLAQADMPLVSFSGPSARLAAHYISFNADWFGRALDAVAAQGRRQVAFLSAGLADDIEQTAFDRARELGLGTRPCWWQVVSPWRRNSARRATELLFDTEPDRRPDALLVTDDHLLDEALAGLLAAGIRVPEEVAVVAHANFPLPTPTALPVRRLGPDLRVALSAALTTINGQRRGASAPALATLPAVWEEEQTASPIGRGSTNHNHRT